MRNLKTILFSGLLAFLAPITILGQNASTTHSRTAKLQVTQCALKVRGMTCGGCAEMVEKGLLKLKGVKAAKVEFKSGEARVEFDLKKIAPDKIVAAFNQVHSGFRVDKTKSGTEQLIVLG